MCQLTKQEFKILKMFYKNSPIPFTAINSYVSRNPKTSVYFRHLHLNGFVEKTPDIKNHIVMGTKDEIRITDKGRRMYIIYKEEHRIFTKKLFATQIVVPIMVTILTNIAIYALRLLWPLLQQLVLEFLPH